MIPRIKNGFTLIELLVVISLLIIIVTISTLGFQNFAQYQRYDYAVATVKTALLNSHTAARNAEGGDAHGVKFSTTNITLFTGETYTIGNPSNEIISFSDVTFITNFSGGTDEVIFTELSGFPTATGTIQIIGSVHTATTTVVVTSTGGIQ